MQVIRYDPLPGGGRLKVLTEEGACYIEQWASKGAVLEELADVLCISRNTFYAPHNKERTKMAYAKGLGRCKSKLRSKQVEEAMDGDRQMLIFLGKVFLGQRETEQTASSELAEFVKSLGAVDADPEEEQ